LEKSLLPTSCDGEPAPIRDPIAVDPPAVAKAALIDDAVEAGSTGDVFDVELPDRGELADNCGRNGWDMPSDFGGSAIIDCD
jgi:hypothetical protein